MGWKKKDNKYISEKSLNEKESKDSKDKKETYHVENYNNKLPEGEKFLGFENVSFIFIHILCFRIRTFAMPTLLFRYFIIANHFANK